MITWKTVHAIRFSQTTGPLEMTIRPFVMWPDQRLRTAVPEVPEITDDIRQIWLDMVETMDAMPGLGLAAVQIGVMPVSYTHLTLPTTPYV